MCTRYISPETREAEAFWRIDRRTPHPLSRLTLHPLSTGPIIRPAGDGLELLAGQWGMIPPGSCSSSASN